MTSGRAEKRIQQSSSAVALVDCSVRVSPALARLIRKSAEQEAKGASAIDALSTSAGVQPGELAALHKQLQQASKEAMQWRDKFVLKRRELEELRIAAASRENETRGELRETAVSLEATQQYTRTLKAEIAALETRIGDLVTTIEHREGQLAHSLSLSGFDDAATAAVNALRNTIALGAVKFTSTIEAEAMIANLSRPEMRSLNNLLKGTSKNSFILATCASLPA
jgi:chromosome segregation ATPase